MRQAINYKLSLVFSLCLVATVRADSPAPSLPEAKQAIAELNAWLGNGANGAGWRKFLHFEVLLEQMQAKEGPDPAVLKKILDLLNGGTPGLEKSRFVKVRDALQSLVDESSVPPLEGLPEVARAAEADFQSPDPARAKQALQAALDRLNVYLTSLGKLAPGWRTYLQVAELKAQLGQEDGGDIETLKSISERFSANVPGLESPPIAAAAQALNGYVTLTEAAGTKDLQDDYKNRLQELSAALASFAQAPNEELASNISRQLDWLAKMQQGTKLARFVRHYYGSSNLFVAAHSDVVGAGIERPIDDVSPIADNILGTQINGTGRTIGRLDVELVPDDKRAVFDAMLVGTTTSNTVGQNGPATIYTQGTTQLAGRKRVYIDHKGIHSYPATAAARTATQIRGVSAGGGLVERIAQRKVAEGKGQAEQEGSRRAEQRVRSRLEKETSVQLGKANRDFQEKFRNPLVRRGQYPPRLDFSTTTEFLRVTALAAGTTQMGAPTNPPKLDADFDLSVQMHESMANNLAAALLAGETLTEEQVQKNVIELRGSLPEQLKSDEDRDPWSITFAKYRPVTLSIDDNGFQVTIRGIRYTSGDRSFKAMNVTATYKIERTEKGSRLVRQGEVEILPPKFVPGETKLSVQQVALKRLLERKFGKLFEPEYESDGLELPGERKQLGKLRLGQLVADNGWLVLGWRKPAPPAVARTGKVSFTKPNAR